MREREEVQEVLREVSSGFRLQVSGYRSILIAVSAACLILCYPPFNIGFLAWFSFIPFFFAIENQDTKKRFTLGYFYGFLFFGAILYWLFKISVPGALILVILLALAPAIFSALCSSSLVSRLSSFVFVPAAWIFTEYMRSHFLTGFPWALLGYSQSYNIPTIQISDITGPYGVSFLIVLINFSVYKAIRKREGRFYVLFFALMIYAFNILYGEYVIKRHYPASELRVASVQGNIPQGEKWDPAFRNSIMRQYVRLSEKALSKKPGLLVWPETAVPGYLAEEKDLKKALTSFVDKNNVHLLVGSVRDEAGAVFNSAMFLSPAKGIEKHYDKSHLVLFGEYMPFGDRLAWVKDYIDKPIAEFNRGSEFTVFNFRVVNATSANNGHVLRTTDFYRFSVLVCFEDIFPDHVRRFVKEGARFLVNITNDAWFGKTSAPYQHLEGSIFRAAENKVPLVRAANTGVSCIIDRTGRVVKYVEVDKDKIFVEGFCIGGIRPSFYRTFYTRFGDVFSWASIALVMILYTVSVIRERKQK
ncbi:MAG: apolipoprotein N-acyltransferase [Candidatus Omnitrophica bacterium]|nr:apolipoprotein N-acyltransferase [Candidatus Omnitrophota bacterium]